MLNFLLYTNSQSICPISSLLCLILYSWGFCGFREKGWTLRATFESKAYFIWQRTAAGSCNSKYTSIQTRAMRSVAKLLLHIFTDMLILSIISFSVILPCFLLSLKSYTPSTHNLDHLSPSPSIFHPLGHPYIFFLLSPFMSFPFSFSLFPLTLPLPPLSPPAPSLNTHLSKAVKFPSTTALFCCLLI